MFDKKPHVSRVREKDIVAFKHKKVIVWETNKGYITNPEANIAGFQTQLFLKDLLRINSLSFYQSSTRSKSKKSDLKHQ